MNSTVNRRIVVTSFALALAAASCADKPAESVVRVTVRDSQFKVVSVISTPDKIMEFEKFWSGREKLPAAVDPTTVRVWAYKLDFSGHRWLYNPNGTITKLGIKASTPTYRIPEPDAFNALLGIKPT